MRRWYSDSISALRATLFKENPSLKKKLYPVFQRNAAAMEFHSIFDRWRDLQPDEKSADRICTYG
jgi:hypothetical protein